MTNGETTPDPETSSGTEGQPAAGRKPIQRTAQPRRAGETAVGRHHYLSTACWHAQNSRNAAPHTACRLTCKYCLESCECWCHSFTTWQGTMLRRYRLWLRTVGGLAPPWEESEMVDRMYTGEELERKLSDAAADGRITHEDVAIVRKFAEWLSKWGPVNGPCTDAERAFRRECMTDPEWRIFLFGAACPVCGVGWTQHTEEMCAAVGASWKPTGLQQGAEGAAPGDVD